MCVEQGERPHLPLLMCRGAAIISFSAAASIRLRTRMRPQCLTFALVVAVLRVAPAASWWGVAHMLTAQVAKDTLPEATVNCVQKQLDRDYYPDYSSFITAALWSDHIKTSKPPFGLNYDGGTRAYNEWHFIDFPFPPRLLTRAIRKKRRMSSGHSTV